MTILAIDPGADTGWCLMSEARKLVAAGLNDPPVEFVGHRVVIERPQIYQGRGSRVNPNDLITLAIGVGRYSERFISRGCNVEEILPHTWKGTLDPDICCRRIWASLDTEEKGRLSKVLAPLARARFEPEHNIETLTAGKRHNVLDAVGLAKWSLIRARAGVFE